MSAHVIIDRGVVAAWPDEADTDRHYDVTRVPVWAWLLLAVTGGFFGAVAYLWLGGA